ncbi:MAG: DUF3050 domain-containing protein [Bdellovibrionales bacterium]|nr:DUF3050 domain-containing protein [Bdellovibrionales bacterium]
MNETLQDSLRPYIEKLDSHQIYKRLCSIQQLRIFMEHHVFAVLDFMSLTKGLQNEFAPITKIWTPPKNAKIARFINEIVLAEESDVMPPNYGQQNYLSHFEIYCLAMEEVGANCLPIKRFIEDIKLNSSLDLGQLDYLPFAAKKFMETTFSFIEQGHIHEIAAAFCFGREKIIPIMFKAILDEIQIAREEAPMFHYYIERHIEVDGDVHSHLAFEMVHSLCQDDALKLEQTKEAAITAITARSQFWDEVSSLCEKAST